MTKIKEVRERIKSVFIDYILYPLEGLKNVRHQRIYTVVVYDNSIDMVVEELASFESQEEAQRFLEDYYLRNRLMLDPDYDVRPHSWGIGSLYELSIWISNK